MKKILSVVIPVYKVEKYIDKCLSSLIVSDEQMELLDVVIVNDGTPDKSAEMARVYEMKYPNVFRVLDQENRGHGGAWNHGTELAVGKYLFYLDSDDWFETSEFSKLIEFLKTCDTDMVMVDNKKYYAETDRYEDTNRHMELEPGKVYDVDVFDWIATGHAYNMTYAHDTIYRTEMLQKYLPLYCEKVMYDDVALQGMPIAIASTFVYMKFDIYRYYIGRPGQSFDPKVRAVRAADDVSKVLDCYFEWLQKWRHVVPMGGQRERYTEENYQSLGTCHYDELSRFEIGIAKPRLAEWDNLIREKYADIKPDKMVRMYRTLPFGCYMAWFRMRSFARRVIRFLLRKLKK